MTVARFEVREIDHSISPNDLVRELVTKGFSPRYGYRVIDTVTGQAVPFGGYRDRDRAQARADREEAKHAETGTEDHDADPS